MLRYLVVFLVAGQCLISGALGGTNPNAKVAVHIMPHASRSCSKSFPAISSCEDITCTYPSGGDVDFFVVFYDLEAYTGFGYSVTWPSEWSSCSFTSCSEFTIGGIVEPGDTISHAWTDCDSSGVCIAGFGWLGDIETPGHISIGPIPGYGIDISDCQFQTDTAVVSCRAGLNGAAGDDPCAGRGAGDGEGEGDELPALRIARMIEVTDGSTFYMQPIWSPDGRKLTFTKSGFSGLYVRSADGSGRIQEITSEDYSGYNPVWTSDSKAIVLRTRTGTLGQRLTCVDVETGDVQVLVERAVHPRQPERNAYGDITVDLDGETKVLDRETGTFETPDEYYPRGQSPPPGVSLEMDFKSNTLTVIEGDGDRRAEFPHKVILASLSPTHDKIAFKLGDGNIYVSGLDGSSMVSIGRGSAWDWSPDGRRLVYLGAYEQNEYSVTATELFVVNADGTGLTQLTHTPDQVEYYPVWSPDGMKIAYSIDNTGKILVAILEEVD
jgi:hypothetical protein